MYQIVRFIRQFTKSLPGLYIRLSLSKVWPSYGLSNCMMLLYLKAIAEFMLKVYKYLKHIYMNTLPSMYASLLLNPL